MYMKGDFFMKKTLILVFIAFIIILLVNQKNSNIIIPKESIRIRIISNSNLEYDIKDKMKVKGEIEKEIYELLKGVKNIEEARNILNNNLDKLNVVVDKMTDNYEISFGNHYFPKKTYKGLIYEEGIYESLVVTLGEGSGDNWWCVLFPPLCLLEGDNEETDDVEYQFFVKELLDKYFS